MYSVLEIIVAALAAFGLCAAGWLLFGRLLTPVGACCSAPVFAVVRARGDGEGLEQTVDGLLWLANGGWVTLRIILLDDGLTETGRRRALGLVKRGPRIAYCPPESVMEAIAALER